MPEARRLKKHYETVSSFDTVLYRGICLWEEVWEKNPDLGIAIEGEGPVIVLTERERRSLVAILERHIKQDFLIQKIGTYHKVSAKKIEDARKLKGLTQVAAAMRVGVKIGTWKDWASGRSRPTEENMKKLVEVLEMEGA